MSRACSNGHFHTTMAAPSSITFFHSVCQLVSTSASPKQPQSLIGLLKASQSVSGVITTMMASTSLDTMRRLMANSKQMPKKNSVAANSTDEASVVKSGIMRPNPIATW